MKPSAAIAFVGLAFCVACARPPAAAVEAPHEAAAPAPSHAPPGAFPRTTAAEILAKSADPPGFVASEAKAVPVIGPLRISPSLECASRVDSLPVLADAETPKRWVFDLRSQGGARYDLLVRDALLAEVAVSHCRAFTWMTSLDRGDSTDRITNFGAYPSCDIAEQGELPATLRGIRASRRAADSVEYVEYDATYDTTTNLGAPRAARSAEAAALWPSVVYAFVAPGPPDELVVLGPPASWLTAPGPAAAQLKPHVGSFSYVRVPLDAGRAASVVMEVRDGDLASFVHSAKTISPPKPSRVAQGGDPNAPLPAVARISIDVADGIVTTRVQELESSDALHHLVAPYAADAHPAAGAPCRGL